MNLAKSNFHRFFLESAWHICVDIFIANCLKFRILIAIYKFLKSSNEFKKMPHKHVDVDHDFD